MKKLLNKPTIGVGVAGTGFIGPVHGEGFPDTFKQLYAKVYDYIIQRDFAKAADFPTFADGHYEMQLCEAMEKSAKTRLWVEVPA